MNTFFFRKNHDGTFTLITRQGNSYVMFQMMKAVLKEKSHKMLRSV